MTNKEKFIEAYTKKLRAAMSKRPEDYIDVVEDAGNLAVKMVDQIHRAHISTTMRQAAKSLGIKTSRAAIIEYVST